MQTQLLYSIIYLFFPIMYMLIARVCTGLVHAACRAEVENVCIKNVD